MKKKKSYSYLQDFGAVLKPKGLKWGDGFQIKTRHSASYQSPKEIPRIKDSSQGPCYSMDPQDLKATTQAGAWHLQSSKQTEAGKTRVCLSDPNFSTPLLLTTDYILKWQVCIYVSSTWGLEPLKLRSLWWNKNAICTFTDLQTSKPYNTREGECS